MIFMRWIAMLEDIKHLFWLGIAMLYDAIFPDDIDEE